jgi:hypothetical protein
MNIRQRFALTDLDCVLADIAEKESELATLHAKARELEEACGPEFDREARLDQLFEKAKIDRENAK